MAESILWISNNWVRIGYDRVQGPIQIYLNLASAEEIPVIVTAEIKEVLVMNNLKSYPSFVEMAYNSASSPLGLINKTDGTKYQMHHLTFPAGDNSSIKAEIPEAYRAIAYSTVDNAIGAV